MNNGKARTKSENLETLLRDLLITSLASTGVKSHTIRKIVGCSMDRVTRITKHIERGE
jgi:hypothetical protein